MKKFYNTKRSSSLFCQSCILKVIVLLKITWLPPVLYCNNFSKDVAFTVKLFQDHTLYQNPCIQAKSAKPVKRSLYSLAESCPSELLPKMDKQVTMVEIKYLWVSLSGRLKWGL